MKYYILQVILLTTVGMHGMESKVTTLAEMRKSGMHPEQVPQGTFECELHPGEKIVISHSKDLAQRVREFECSRALIAVFERLLQE